MVALYPDYKCTDYCGAALYGSFGNGNGPCPGGWLISSVLALASSVPLPHTQAIP